MNGNSIPAAARRGRLWWILGALALVGAAAGSYFVFQRSAPEAGTGRTAESSGAGPRRAPGGGRPFDMEPLVAVAKVERGSIELEASALGTVSALNSAVVRSRVDGELIQLHFTEGQWVKAGAPLAQIDPRPFEVQLAQAEGARARDAAQLANAREDLARYQTLLAQESIAVQQVSNQQALVRQYEAAVKVDEAQVASARLNLRYAAIVAPISGRLGLRQVHPGNIVRASDSEGVVSITQESPIAVVFALPEAHLPAVREAMGRGRPLQVQAWDRENRTRLAQGELLTLDNQIDASTGTIKAKAVFANREATLFPNQFVNARLQLGRRDGLLCVPQAALQTGTPGHYVYVVDAEHRAHVRKVKVGPASDGRVGLLEAELNEGDWVVVDGLDRVREGGKVKLSGDAPAPAAPEAGRRRHRAAS